ncbi:MAG: alpha-amylase family glycosyl hydrolase [Pseudomonadota bacterium]
MYPRSFQDSTGTGEGDLRGIVQRLDHVARLGVDAIWLSPFYTSPMCDGGYDVADAMAVDPRFGTLDDFDAVVARAHELGLKVMIDQVFNHTSVEHAWFQKSRAGDPDYADFYVWANARPDGGPPSNWIGYFGHPAWRWHAQRGQYCLHQFLPCQPGLNHRNPQVHAELQKVTDFWRNRGVDGFRYDAVTSFYYDPLFRDNPPAGADQALIPGPPNNPFTMQRHDNDMLPDDCAAFAARIRGWAGDDAYLIGEINEGPKSVEVLQAFAGKDRLDAGYVVDVPERGVSGTVLADVIARMDAPGSLIWWLSSHDQKRHVSRAGDGSARDARMLAALLLGLPGPVLLYQGEELGMPQPDLAKEVLTDPFDLAYWPDPPGRDGARTPIPWEDGLNLGFSTAKPWLPVATPPDGPAAVQWQTQGSVLMFYQEAIARRRELGLHQAEIEVVVAEDTKFAARLTGTGAEDCGLVVNLADAPCSIPADWLECGKVVLSSVTQCARDQVAPRSAVWLLLNGD